MLRRCLSLLIVFVSSVDAQFEEFHCGGTGPSSSSSSRNPQYDWERLDYYNILDLEQPDDGSSRKERRQRRAKIDTKAVKKAYRQQAQLYHPDKATKKEGLSLEESNSRFARIAEAYEVLSDDTKRSEYDYWLLDCEDRVERAKSSSTYDNTAAPQGESWFGDVTTDPRKLFEEFFFGSLTQDDPWDEFDDFASSFSGFSRNGGSREQRPVRILESRESHRDPYSGTEFFRIYTKEEYSPNQNGVFFYRIMVQDYVEHFDRFRGLVYNPITQPTLYDEGYEHVPEDSSSFFGERELQDSLLPHEVLTIDSQVLRSANGRHYAGINSQCELLVASSEHDGDDVLLWSSDTYVPQSHLYKYGGCFLTLSGPHLVLALGNPERPGAILWHSNVRESVIDEDQRIQSEGDPHPIYFARLDDDGSFVVYSQRTFSYRYGDDESRDGSPDDFFAAFSNLETKSVGERAVKAWSSLRSWTVGQFRRRRSDSELQEVCVWASGAAGCNRPVRKLLHVAQGITHSVKSVGNALDSFVDSLDSEEDSDVLDTLIRIVGNAGNAIGRAGRRIARKGTKAVSRKRQQVVKAFFGSR